MTSILTIGQECHFSGDCTQPKLPFRLEYIYVYRSANCRSNIHLTDEELVYFSEAFAIVLIIFMIKIITDKDFFLAMLVIFMALQL
jgi:hypothetical protein